MINTDIVTFRYENENNPEFGHDTEIVYRVVDPDIDKMLEMFRTFLIALGYAEQTVDSCFSNRSPII
jgi:hypothetical protein